MTPVLLDQEGTVLIAVGAPPRQALDDATAWDLAGYGPLDAAPLVAGGQGRTGRRVAAPWRRVVVAGRWVRRWWRHLVVALPLAALVGAGVGHGLGAAAWAVGRALG